MEKRRVVITGMGTVNPLGHNVAESWQAVLDGFYAQNLMAAAWCVFLAFTLALAVWFDWQRAFRFKNKSAELVLQAQKGTARWALYYALVLAIFGGLLMASGGFGGASFAYGGF